MSKTVFTLPENLIPGDRGLIAWIAEQGVDPHLVVVDPFRIDEEDDGTLTMHFVEFALDADGKRQVVCGPSGTYEDGGYAKNPPRSVTVSSLPTLQTVVS